LKTSIAERIYGIQHQNLFLEGNKLKNESSIFAPLNSKHKMEPTKIIELLSYTLPAVITGGVAYYFFNLHIKNEENRRRFLQMRESQKQAMPLRLQAYERMTLFLERINLSKMLLRVTPLSENTTDYANFVIAQVEQEFEHNLAQQIYITDECWNIINASKNITIQLIRRASLDQTVKDANGLRELILNNMLETPSPTNAALAFIKNEVSHMW